MFQRKTTLFALALLALLTRYCGAQVPVDGYAAIVSERIITIGDVMQYLRPVEMQLRQSYEGKELEKKLEEAFIKSREALIEEALVLTDFANSEMQIPEQLIDERVNTIIHERFDDDRAAFLEALASQRMTMQEMREQVKDGLVLMILRRQEVSDRVSISPLAILELYQENVEKYREPEQVKLRMIAISKGKTPEDHAVKRKEIEEIHRQLTEENADFTELAKQVSEDNKAQYGGDWGWIEAANLRSELADAAARLTPGQISDVIDTGDTLYIMTIEARKAAGLVPLEEARPQLERELRAREEERLYNEWINRLRKKYYIQIIN
jgi:parvulin-like peptidyl-prolyl isomerase